MLLLTTNPWRRLLLPTRAGYPLPLKSRAPANNEIVLLARVRRTPAGRVHVVHTALRAVAVRLKPLSPWRGRSRWIIRAAHWKLAQPFQLEGIQLTPSEYRSRGALVPLDPTDVDEIY
ncbi:MAG TPA: hypothetical protein VFU45_03560, partial [Gemmatimonadales bacterium]|nr:hypothetical protein [Gemmatimonadales bacterium]